MGTPYLAEVKIISWNFPPKGWAFCNGQLLPINQNQALYSLVGTTYGGDGQTTFGLPNLSGRIPVGWGSGTGGSIAYGQVGGESSHTVTVSEMPAHSHVPTGSSAEATGINAAGSTVATTAGQTYTQTAAGLAALVAGSVTTSGGSQPHDNMQPYLALNFVIALQGIFPSRN